MGSRGAKTLHDFVMREAASVGALKDPVSVWCDTCLWTGWRTKKFEKPCPRCGDEIHTQKDPHHGR